MGGKKQESDKTRAGKQNTKAAAWSALTWDDLEQWAGSRSVSRGQTYQKQGRVKNLAIATDGRLLATVAGTHRYAVSVWFLPKTIGSRALESVCTCPVGDSGCKHAVAVVAEYLAALADEQEVPVADPNDRRWAKLSNRNAWNEYDEHDDDFEDEADVGEPSPGQRRTSAQWNDKIQALIRQKDQAELADLVWSLVQRFPELRAEFQERIALSEGDVNRLVADARKEMRTVTSEVGWRNHWQNEGHTPDYSRLKHRLERLVEQGHPDEVVKLGRELIERGMQQVGESHDEGETSIAFAECLPVVFNGIAQSSLAPPDKILFAIDACLADDYDLIGEAANDILEADWPNAVWSAVADQLAARLPKTSLSKEQDDFSRNYRRDRISAWLLTALESSGREDELSAVHEAEARNTGCYERLVRFLLDQGRIEDAEQWAREGIQKTQEKLPGIAASLQRMLCEVACGRKQWDVVAAHAAAAFFEHPSSHGFDELVAAAKKARCAEPVRAAALLFLETGKTPFRFGVFKGKTVPEIEQSWLLPVLDYLAPRPRSGVAAHHEPRPHFDVLLEMAIAAKRPDEILKWYDKMVEPRKTASRISGGLSYPHHSYGDQVAAAVAISHPERALEIYQRELNCLLPQTGQPIYESCAKYLKKMRPICEAQGSGDSWKTLVADIRQKYGNRPRFMEILNKLEGRTILSTHKSPRR